VGAKVCFIAYKLCNLPREILLLSIINYQLNLQGKFSVVERVDFQGAARDAQNRVVAVMATMKIYGDNALFNASAKSLTPGGKCKFTVFTGRGNIFAEQRVITHTQYPSGD